MVQTRSKRKRRDENEREENLVTAAIQEFCKDSGRLSHRLTDEEIRMNLLEIMSRQNAECTTIIQFDRYSKILNVLFRIKAFKYGFWVETNL